MIIAVLVTASCLLLQPASRPGAWLALCYPLWVARRTSANGTVTDTGCNLNSSPYMQSMSYLLYLSHIGVFGGSSLFLPPPLAGSELPGPLLQVHLRGSPAGCKGQALAAWSRLWHLLRHPSPHSSWPVKHWVYMLGSALPHCSSGFPAASCRKFWS